jgi:very-short-patch-repair endonuclease
MDGGAGDRTAGEYRDLLGRKIEDLRARLLNLTLTNKLLNFSHSDRSRGFVRVVDALPSVLFEKLSERAITFRPLPSLEEEPADEATDEFRMAVDAARLTDEHYRADIAALEAEGENGNAADKLEKSERIERALKDRVRAALDMPRRQTASDVSLSEHARLHGIAPSFDLPGAGENPADDRWHDTHIQLLLLPEMAERKLSGLLDLTNSYLQETGINTLYAAFGFLQWYEDASSDTPRYAPLLLLPLQIQRRVQGHAYVYQIAGTGDEPVINISLKEKLKTDFHLALPELDDEEGPDTYMARVAEAVKKESRWKVRRWVTIGIFPFARMALYHDLDLSRWPKGKGLLDHDIITEMLIGRESNGDEEANETDEMVSAAKLPLLITDADSSQAAAIIDALDRDRPTLVVKGPPGTGKSQTITNLIAAALDRGQRVLFVAEKLAALNVVQSRLEKAGLDPFCLALHSEKARKTDVLKSLKDRLELKASRAPADLDAKIAELEKIREELDRYAHLLNEPLGLTGRTVHEILWAAQRAQSAADQLPERLRRLTVKNAAVLTQDTIERARGHLGTIEKAYAGLARDGYTISNHLWRGVAKSPLTPFDIEEICDALTAWLDSLRRLEPSLARMKEEFGWAPAPSLAGIALAGRAAQLADPGGLQLRCSLLPALKDAELRKGAAEFLAQLAELRSLKARIAEKLGHPLTASPNDLAAIGAQAAAVRCEQMTPVELEQEIRRLDGLRQSHIEAGEAATELAIAFGYGEALTVRDVDRLVRTTKLVSEAERDVLGARTPNLIEEGARVLLTRGYNEAERLREAQDKLARLFHLERQVSPEVIDTHAAELRNAGRLSFLRIAYRNSKRFFRSFAIEHGPNDAAGMALALENVAKYLRDRTKLETDKRLAAICGKRFDGLDTDFGLLLKVVDLADAVRTELSGVGPLALRLRDTVLGADMATIDGLRAFACRPALARLGEIVRAEGPESKRALKEMSAALDKRIAELSALRDKVVATGLNGRAVSFQDLPGLAVDFERMTAQTLAVGTSTAMRALMGGAFQGEATDVAGLTDTIAYVDRLASADLPNELLDRLLVPDLGARVATLKTHAAMLPRLALAAEEARECFGTAAAIDWSRFFGAQQIEAIAVSQLRERLEACDAKRRALVDWATLWDAINTGRRHGFDLIVDAFLEEGRPLVGLFEGYELVIYRSMAREAYALEGGLLARHSGLGHEALGKRFRELDREILQLNRQKLSAELLRRPVPAGISRGRKSDLTEAALIHHEAAKARRHIPLRDLMRRAGAAVQALKPCFMMSPLSTAQYISPGSVEFDLLIIDEASQMKPEEAIGAFARSRRAVVVGDPQQLPPTSFFERNLLASVDESEEEEEKVANESILDLAMAAFRPARTLRWHYRSRHGSLIAFSNRYFYENRLIVFPTPNHAHPDYGVHYRHIDGVYEAGTNLIEAKAVVEAALDCMRRRPDRSLAIVTMNQAQRELIHEEMQRVIARDDRASRYVERWSEELEPFVVKNLENIQGDERDCILISCVYGPNAQGQVMQRFGPINSANGHRRLNVLFTRAKLQTTVFSSMAADQIRADSSASRGVHALKGYLSFAATGVLEGGIDGSGREPDSDFEVWVAEQIRALGCEVVAQVGVAGYYIDIGVKHASFPHGFILGVECDGAMYHSSKAARDRDRLRQEVLEGLGWDIHRVWSTDWFSNPNGEVAKMRQRIEQLLVKKGAQIGSAEVLE